MNKKLKLATLSMGVTMIMAAGCSGGNGGVKPDGGSNNPDNTAPKVSTEPVELLFFTAQNSVYADEKGFEDEIGQHIKKKYPHITIKHIHKGTGQDYKDLIAAGTIPDIILESARAGISKSLIDNGLHYDLTDLIKKYNLDLTQLNPAAMAQIKYHSPEGKIYALPFTLSDFIMFYNKDLFDKFGVPYPKDGMTYDEVYDLAKKLARTEGGVTYKGFMAHAGLMLSYNQMSLSSLDPKKIGLSLIRMTGRSLSTTSIAFTSFPIIHIPT